MVALFVVVTLVALLLFVALTVDVARMVTTEQHLRTAADAGALAGAAEVKIDTSEGFIDTITLARDVANQNRVDQHAAEIELSDVQVGRWDTSADPPVFVPYDPEDAFSPDAVRVAARRDETTSYGALQMTFARLAGVDSVSLAKFATARSAPVGNPLILVLHPSNRGALHVFGNADLLASNGVVQVNSNDNRALYVQGNAAHMTAAQTRVVGNYSGNVSPLPVTGVAPILDPLAELAYPLPDPDDIDDTTEPMVQPLGPEGQITGEPPGTVYLPGHYPKGISMGAAGSLAILDPGVYAVGGEGGGIEMNGGRLEGNGVMLFVEKGGTVRVTGNAEVEIRPPTSGIYQGLSLFHHRDNVSVGQGQANKVCDFSGLGAFEMAGTVYIAGGKLDIAGDQGKTIGSMIVNELAVTGDTTFTITGEGIPPWGADYVYLVE